MWYHATMKARYCHKCTRFVYDARIVQNGNVLALDVDPWPNGNMLIREADDGSVECKPLNKREIASWSKKRDLYKPHICVPPGVPHCSADDELQWSADRKLILGKGKKKREEKASKGQEKLFTK